MLSMTWLISTFSQLIVAQPVILQIGKAITIAILLIQLTGCATMQWENVDINQVITDIGNL